MLQIANFLLYFNAVYALLDALSYLSSALSSGIYFLVFLLAVVSVVTSVLGGMGLAERRKRGYQLAVVAAFMPAITRGVIVAMQSSVVDAIVAAVGIKQLTSGRSAIGYLFELALIALLAHPESRNYQRIWFD